MKIGLFSDSHYCNWDRNGKIYHLGLEKIERALAHFEAEKCDFVVCLGDLVDKEPTHEAEIENLQKVAAVMDKYALPTYVVVGNHDTLNFTKQDFYAILGEKHRPCNMRIGEKNFIFTDTCFFADGREFTPELGWDRGKLKNTDEFFKALADCEGQETYVFTHFCIDPAVAEGHRAVNAEEIRTALEKDGRVRAVFEGHHHKLIQSETNGIRYFTCLDMLGHEDAYYVIEV